MGGLLVLVLAAALVLPPFINWTSYRADFEREASRILGRKVTVGGQASARLLPFPSVSFSDVSVAGVDGGPPAMTAKSFSMDAELSPFLRGEILIFDMRLNEPHLTIAVDDTGVLDWAIRPQAPAGVSDITLENVQIINGMVVVRHAASGTDQTIADINATLSADSLAGPWRMAGRALAGGRPGAFSISTGTVTEEGRMRLRVQAEPDDLPVVLETDGNAYFEDGAPRYAGTFQVGPRAEETADEAATQPFAISIDKEAAWTDLRFSGGFTLNHESLALDTVRLESGPVDDPYTAEGTGFIDLGREPRFVLKLEGRQVQLPAKDTAGAPISFAARLAAFRTFLDWLPRFSMAGSIDMSLPAVVAGDTTVRDLSFTAQPRPDGWTLSHFTARLPGRTTLEASGILRNAGEVSFDGKLLLAIAQPSGFASWLTDDVDETIRRLGSAGFSADVNLSTERQSARNLEIVLGGVKFTGLFDRLSPEGEQPASIVELDGGGLDLDGLRALAVLFLGERGDFRLAQDDLDLKLKAGPVAFSGLTAAKLDTAIRLKGGRLDIDRLAIQGLEGANLSATGQFDGFPAIRSGAADVTVLSDDMAGLALVLSRRFPENAILSGIAARTSLYSGLLGDARLDLNTRLEDDAVTVSGQGTAGGTQMDLRVVGTRAILHGDGDLQVSLSGRNEDGDAILAAWGAPVLPIGLAGRVETGLQIRGSRDDGYTVSGTISGPSSLMRFSGSARQTDAGLQLTGKGEAKGEDFSPWLMATGYGLPGLEIGLPAVLETPVTWSDGILGLAGLKGQVAGTDVSGALEVKGEGGRMSVTGDLTAGSLALDPLVGTLLGPDSVSMVGSDAWLQHPFVPAGAIPLDAKIGITAGELTLSGLPKAENATLRIGVEADRIRLSSLAADFGGGKISGLAELTNTGGNAILSTQVRIDGADLARIAGGDALSGAADISASISGSGKTPEGLIASLSGSGTANVKAVEISGLNASAYASIVTGADAAGPQIDQAKVEEIALPVLRAGSLSVPEADFAFTVAGGVIRTPPLRIDAGTASLSADLSANLSTGQMEAGGTLSFNPGDDELAGSEPSVGYRWTSEQGLVFDTGPLSQFLTQRALEKEQARVEAMQALLLEKQRLRRESAYFSDLARKREAALRAELERQAAEEEARQKAEDAAQQRLNEQAPEDGAAPVDPAADPDRPGAARETGPGQDVQRAPLAPPEQQSASSPSTPAPPALETEGLTIEDLLQNPKQF
nr:AsmA family protein [Zhengella mangrovi]